MGISEGAPQKIARFIFYENPQSLQYSLTI